MSFQIADGHVEVHLRDNTEREWQQIRRRLEAAARNPVGIRVEVSGDQQALQRIERLNRQLARLRALASRPIEIRVDFDGGGAEQAMQRMVQHMQMLQRQSADFSSHWQQTWQRFGDQGQQWSQNMRAGFNQAGQAGMVNMQLVGKALLALPAAAVVASTGITLALGGALSGLGLGFAAQAAVVRTEWGALASHLKARMQDISQPFEQTWLDIADMAQETFQAFEPELEGAFKRLAPTVSAFAEDLGEAFEQLAPHVDEWVDSFQEVLRHLGPQLKTVFSNIGQAMTELTDAAGRNPKVFGEMLQDASALLVVMGQLAGAATDFYSAMNPLSGKLTEATGATGELVGVLLEFMKIAQALNNPISGLVYLWDTFAGPIRQAIDVMRGGTHVSNDMANGLNSLARSAATAIQSQGAAAGAFGQMGSKAAEAAAQLQRLNQQLGYLKQDALSAKEANLAFKDALAQAAKTIKDGSHALSGNTSKSRENQRALLAAVKAANDDAQAYFNLRKSTVGAEQATAEANARLRANAKALIDAAVKAGANREAVTKLVNATLKIPSKRTTKIEQPGIGDAIRASKTLNSAVRSVPTTWTTYFRTVRIGDAIRNSKNMNYADGGITFNAQGNVFPTVRSFAGGGENHTAQIARGGMVRVWAEPETGGEAYIPLASSKRERSEQILAQVADRFGLMLTRPVSFADGGMTAVSGGKPRLGVRKDRTTEVPKDAKQAMTRLLRELTRAMMSSLDKVNDWAKRLNEQIRKQFSGAQEKRLLGWAQGIEQRMRQAARRAEAIADKIREARDYAANTTQAAKQFASVQGLGTVGGARDILSGLQFRAGQLQTFAGQINALKARGINNSLLDQVVQLGAGQGSNLAEALLKADPETWKRLNEAQAAIDAAANRLGRGAADALYDSGRHAADGFLTGLKAQQEQLGQLMDRLGDRLANRLRDLFDLPAPKPKPKLGAREDITRRADGGIVRAGRWAMVGERGRELVKFGADAMVHSNAQTEAMLGGGTTINITINVTGTFDLSDSRAAERFAAKVGPAIREQLRRLEMSYR